MSWARAAECARGQEMERRSPPNEQLRSLESKIRCKTREHGSCREHCLSREPPGYYFGERVLHPECSSRWLWSDVFSTWTSSAGCMDWWMLGVLCEKKTLLHCTKLLERAVYWGEQDGELIRRAAHQSRTHAWRSSWPSTPCSADREDYLLHISFGCLIFGGAHKSIFVFVYCSFEKLYSKVAYSCYGSSDLYCRHQYLFKRHLFVCHKLSHRFTYKSNGVLYVPYS